MTTEAAV
ncbi:hypothetical protein ACOMHN_004958 [Nucella lapillus]